MEQRPRGRPAGKRSKTSWDAMRRRPKRQPGAAAARAASPVEPEQSDSSASACDGASDGGECEEKPNAELEQMSKFELIAGALWSTDYTDIFDAEFADNERECGGTPTFQ